MTITPMQTVLDALDRLGRKHKGSSDKVSAQCPAHDDTAPSLSVTFNHATGKVLLNCQRGCRAADVVAALGLKWEQLFEPRDDAEPARDRALKPEIVKAYDYPDEHGQVLFQKVRYVPKTFKIRRPDGRGGWIWGLGDTRKVLYNLDLVAPAVAAGKTVVICEGEKDADRVVDQLGMAATCNFEGAAVEGQRSKWRDEYSEHLRGAKVLIVADNDSAGIAHAKAVEKSLRAVNAKVQVFLPAVDEPKADLTDHFDAGYGLEDLRPIDDPSPAAAIVSADRRGRRRRAVRDRGVPCRPVRDPHSGGGVMGEFDGADDAPTTERRLVFRRASTIVPRPVRWAWDTAPAAEPRLREGRFPIGSLVIGVGRAGVGKSQCACWLTAQITKGTLPGAFYGHPRSVVYAATEDSWEMTIVPRLIAAGADLELVYHISVQDDGDPHATLTLPSDTRQLEQGIRDHDVAMVVMDPLLSLLDSCINDYRAREVRQALEPLVAVADRTRVLLFGLAHFTKATGNDPLMLLSGSAAFGQLVRSAIAFARDDEASEPDAEKFVCSTIKNNLGRENLPSLEYTIEPVKVDTPEGDAWVSRLTFTGEEAERSVHDILRTASAPSEDHDDRDEAVRWLKQYLDSNQHRADAKKALADARAAGFSVDQAKRAKKRLKVRSEKSGMAGGWDWVGPDGEVQEPRSNPGPSGRQREGSTKGAKGARAGDVPPSHPSVLPSNGRTVISLFPGRSSLLRCAECECDLPLGAESGDVCLGCASGGAS